MESIRERRILVFTALGLLALFTTVGRGEALPRLRGYDNTMAIW